MENNVNKKIDLSRGEGTISTIQGKKTVSFEIKKYCKHRDGQIIRKSFTCPTPDACKVKMADFERGLKDTPLSDLISLWAKNSKRYKQSSLRTISKQVNLYIKDSSLEYVELTEETVKQYLEALAAEFGDSTVRGVASVLNSYCKDIGIPIKVNKIRNEIAPSTVSNSIRDTVIRAKPRKIEIPQPLSLQDLEKMTQYEVAFAKYSSGRLRSRYRAPIIANFYMGLSYGEFLALRWDDIDWENHAVEIGRKATHRYEENAYVEELSDNQRVIKIPDPAYDLLKAYRDMCDDDDGDLILHTTSGQIVDARRIMDTLKAIYKACDIDKKPSFTSMRDTAVVYLRQTMKEEEVAEYLGMEFLKFSNLYEGFYRF